MKNFSFPPKTTPRRQGMYKPMEAILDRKKTDIEYQPIN
jgi:hypothetical protein